MVASQTDNAAQEQAIQDRACQARLRFERQIEEQESRGVPAEQPPPPANMGLNSQSTGKTTLLLHISALSNVIPTSTTSVNSKTIPSWMTDTRQRFESVFIAANDKSVVELWLKFKELLGYPDDWKTRLTKDLRPQQLSDWMQRHRLWNKAPPVDKASKFGATWKAWRKTLQPEWRLPNNEAHQWPLVRDLPLNKQWEKLVKGGKNGFALVLLSLTWWMMREKDESRKTVESSSACVDVQWMLEQMVQMLHAQREQGGEGEDEGEGEEDPNTRPKKR
jgi:hypothetical protein